jgi:hypothetical protein
MGLEKWIDDGGKERQRFKGVVRKGKYKNTVLLDARGRIVEEKREGLGDGAVKGLRDGER